MAFNRGDIGVEAIAVVLGGFLSGEFKLHLLKRAALTSSIGAIMSVFMLTIPVFLETGNQPGKLIQQWSRVFHHGHIKGPSIAILTGAVYAYAAWSKAAAGQPWRVFALAGATTVAIVPYTWTVMQGTNNRLFLTESQVRKGVDPSWADAERLVTRWGKLNAIRAFIPLAGCVIGLMGTCKMLIL
ncbi:hypothetical protein SCUP515_09238 [Seiridium cupressi]